MTQGETPDGVLVEACVTTVDEAVDAERHGAGRLELCVRLEVNGLTPPADLVREVSASVALPVFVLVRPRDGDYSISPREALEMAAAVALLRDAGAAGIVLGAVDRSGAVQRDETARLVEAAAELPVTFHRAFDATRDAGLALDTLIGLGVRRVLTSGHAGRAIDGARGLASMVAQSGGRIGIMAGGQVRGDHVRELVRRTGVREVHARAEAVPSIVAALREGGS